MLPDWSASAVASALALAAPLAVPTEKTKAPCTGWESAEITRQATTYVPRGRWAGSEMATAWLSPSGWWVPPLSTRLPSGPRTRSEPKSISTGSPKWRTTWVGATSTTEPCTGSVDSSWAWAPAGTAVVTSSTATPTGAARSRSSRLTGRPAGQAYGGHGRGRRRRDDRPAELGSTTPKARTGGRKVRPSAVSGPASGSGQPAP